MYLADTYPPLSAAAANSAPSDVIPLEENESLIGLARAMCTGLQGDYWRRFVLTKELMHCFDQEEDKTDTPEKFDAQIEKFADPTAVQSRQSRAENVAFWRALAVLCREDKRFDYRARLRDNKISFDLVSAELEIPTIAVRELMRQDFEGMLPKIM